MSAARGPASGGRGAHGEAPDVNGASAPSPSRRRARCGPPGAIERSIRPAAIVAGALRRACVTVLVAGVAVGCATTLEVTRTQPAPLRPTDGVLAVAASGPYAPELVGGARALVSGRLRVEPCVLGCPPVGLYASLSLTPGPQEGRTPRSCQAEVYTGTSWVTPGDVRGTFVTTVDDVEACLAALGRWLTQARRDVARVRLDETGPLREVAGLARAGRLDEARARLEALVAAGDASAGAWFDLAVVFEALGQRAEARRCHARALERGPPPWMRASIEAFFTSSD